MLIQPASEEKMKKSPFARLFEELSEKHDEETLSRIAGKASASIFPGLGLIHHQVRTWRPLTPELTEVVVYPYDTRRRR